MNERAAQRRRGLLLAESGTAAEREALWSLRRALGQVQSAREQVRREVAAARSAGLSWSDIGFALGISRQAVREAFGS